MKRLVCFVLAISILVTPITLFNAVAEQNNTVPSSNKALAGSNLTGRALKIYQYLSQEIKKIAEGKRESTIFNISETWTVTIPRNIYDDVQQYAQRMGQLTDELNSVVFALRADFPLEFSWCYDFSLDIDEIGTLYPDRQVITYGPEIRMKVCPDFRKSPNDEYTVSHSWVESVNLAVEKAKAIVAANSTKSDYQKLKAYRDAICDLVDYNHDAWDSENGQKMEYGNPWQILWVFDDDPTTDVVCEAYAKAFKYLCDLSNFKSNIAVLYVTGKTDYHDYEDNDGVIRPIDGHAWNVVHMDDGQNYVVDITWGDDSFHGAKDDNADQYEYLHFLSGYDIGSVGEGYDFFIMDTHFSYYKEYKKETYNLYPYEQLDLAQFCVYLPSPDDPDYVKRLWPLISIYGPESQSIQQGEKYPLGISFPWNTNKQFLQDAIYGVIEVYKNRNGIIDWNEKMSEEVLSFQNSLLQSSPVGVIVSEKFVNSTIDLEPGEYTIRVVLFKNNDNRRFYSGVLRFTVTQSNNPPMPQISYQTIFGDGQNYLKGSNEDKEFNVKRSEDDDKTFSLFRGIQTDGVDVDASNYEASKGSVVIKLKASYLETLAVGDHVLTVLFEDGKDDIPFTVSAAETPVKPIDPTKYTDVAVPSDSFTFKKVWQGDSEKTIDFTLYKADGTVYHHGFDKKIVSNREWRYNAWFSAPAACYVIEKPIPGYQTKYVNVGVYAQITDRCCDGGTIINKKIPKTGDTADLALWAGLMLAGIAGLTALVLVKKRRKAEK